MFALPPALAALAAGAVLLQWQPVLPPVGLWLAASAGAALAAVALHAAAGGTSAAKATIAVLAAAAAGALGFGYAGWRAEVRLADALPAEWEGVDVALVGVVDDLPQAGEQGTRFAFTVERVDTPGAVVPGRLSLAWYAQRQKEGEVDPVPSLAAGERWQLTVRLKRPHGTVNPHGFDVEAWLLENGFRAAGYVRSDVRNVRVDAFAGRPADYVQRTRTAVRDRIVAALPGAPYAGVIVALTIGEQRAIPEPQWRVFNRTGVTHLISISGLHVTVFAAIAGGFAFVLARRSVWLTTHIPARRIAAAVGVAAAAMYVLLAGAQVPAVRTLLMLVVAAIGLWLSRPGTATVVWLWALAAVLAWDPWAGFSPGFWLSFGAVGLLLYAHAGRLQGAPAPSRAARAFRALRAAARTQALVTIGLVPGTLALFEQVSLVSPLANALAIPAVTFVVVPLALTGIVVPVDVLWQAAHAAFAALMSSLEWLAAAPAAVWQQHAPPGWTIAVAVAGAVWLASPRGIPGRALGFVALVPLFVVRPQALLPGTFRMTVLDVGQGLAVVVQTHGSTLLYDTGPRYTEDADAGSRIVAPYLRAAGIRRLDGMIVTHQDSDHSGGALSRAADGAGGLARLVAGRRQSDPGRQRARGWRCNALRRRPALGVGWRALPVLQPAAVLYQQDRVKPNDLSCVVRIDSAFGSALLTGDLEARGERDLVRADPAALKSDVLLVPHHGSLTSSTPAFVAAVSPAVAVYTPGYRNRYGHPRAAVVARYDAAGIRSFRTDYDGALTFTFAPGVSREPRAERDHDRRYWRDAPVREALPPVD